MAAKTRCAPRNALAHAAEGEEAEELEDLIDMTDEAPVIRWVNNLFYTAVRERASRTRPPSREVPRSGRRASLSAM